MKVHSTINIGKQQQHALITVPDGIEDDGVEDCQQGEGEQVDEDQIHPIYVDLSMNWWMNEWMNEWMDEWMNKWMNE